jgi:hypothetical protein
VPGWLAPYRTRIRSAHTPHDGAVHFFLDDYRFESLWTHKDKALKALRTFKTALTPDFSLDPDWPLAAQVWNTFRNRWCGAYWAAHGYTVIPTVSWSTPESYPFCFQGVPPRSLVAISTVGVRRQDDGLFRQGFVELIARLSPSLVLCYGPLAEDLQVLVPVKTYPTRWMGIRRARAG